MSAASHLLLPEGWYQYQTVEVLFMRLQKSPKTLFNFYIIRQGYDYYHFPETGESIWEHPATVGYSDAATLPSARLTARSAAGQVQLDTARSNASTGRRTARGRSPDRALRSRKGGNNPEGTSSPESGGEGGRGRRKVDKTQEVAPNGLVSVTLPNFTDRLGLACQRERGIIVTHGVEKKSSAYKLGVREGWHFWSINGTVRYGSIGKSEWGEIRDCLSQRPLTVQFFAPREEEQSAASASTRELEKKKERRRTASPQRARVEEKEAMGEQVSQQVIQVTNNKTESLQKFGGMQVTPADPIVYSSVSTQPHTTAQRDFDYWNVRPIPHHSVHLTDAQLQTLYENLKYMYKPCQVWVFGLVPKLIKANDDFSLSIYDEEVSTPAPLLLPSSPSIPIPYLSLP
jgi:hypothetical protein